jgi:outer membrane protein assembly factor BamD (BamD/ComL family)
MMFLLSCAGTAPVQDVEPAEEEPLFPAIKDTDMTPEEQEAKVFELFNEILRLSMQGRSTNRDAIVDLYKTIIIEYPDAPLAQEGYLRLIEMYLREFQPPEKARALHLYKWFKERYPESPAGPKIEQTITAFLYRSEDWEEILSLCRPYIKEFIETGEMESSFYMYLYSEAKYHLKDYKEAYKGYKIIISRFPGSSEARLSENRIMMIEKQRTE